MDKIITINVDHLVTVIMAITGILFAFAMGYKTGKNIGEIEDERRAHELYRKRD